MRKSFATIGMSLAVAVMTMPALAAAPIPSTSIPPTLTVRPILVLAPRQGIPIRPTAPRERHPELRRAITSLERAKYALQHANHDFGGHRADALAATDKAIEQLRIAIQYDTK
jgi:hypothetical protein